MIPAEVVAKLLAMVALVSSATSFFVYCILDRLRLRWRRRIRRILF